MSALADGPTARPGFVPAPPSSSERVVLLRSVAYTQGERPSFQRIDITGKRKRDSSRPAAESPNGTCAGGHLLQPGQKAEKRVDYVGL